MRHDGLDGEFGQVELALDATPRFLVSIVNNRVKLQFFGPLENNGDIAVVACLRSVNINFTLSQN